MDVVLLLDASGSITQKGFDVVKDLSFELVNHFSPKRNGTKLSVATFAKQASVISALTDDASEITSKLDQELIGSRVPVMPVPPFRALPLCWDPGVRRPHLSSSW